MNIIVVCHYGLYQDLSMSFVHAQAKAYAAQGHQVRVLIPLPLGKNFDGKRFGKPVTRAYADGVELFYLRFPSLSNFGARTGFNTRSALFAINQSFDVILRDFIPDVIHAHTLGFDSGIGAWLKERLHCPLVVTTHGSDASIPYEQGRLEWLRQQCDRVDTVTAVSSALADKVRESGTRTPVCSILNGFAIGNLPTDIAKQIGAMVQVGHLQTQKRQAVTLQAFAALRQAHPNMTLTLIGQGPERTHLENLCISLHIADAVRFTGQISNKDVLAEMAKAQFFCMPSVREGFGIVYLEAMASGCITVGTQGEGIADLIENGINGFLVPPDDPDAIVEAVEWCLSHPEEATAIAQRGRKDAMALTWERNAEQYINLFQSLIER